MKTISATFDNEKNYNTVYSYIYIYIYKAISNKHSLLYDFNGFYKIKITLNIHMSVILLFKFILSVVCIICVCRRHM